MIESIDNAIQVLVVCVCGVISFFHAVSTGRREWILLCLSYAAAFAGTLYWQIYVSLYYAETPFNTFIADMSWFTADYFLLLLILFVKERKRMKRPPAVMMLIPLFTAGMCAFYVTYGSVVSNIITMALFTLLMWNAADGIALIRYGEETHKDKAYLYYAVFFYCAVEYALWTSSCFFSEVTIANPYFWFDLLLSVTYMMFIPAVRKVVGR